jgi:hypothetical protein
MTSRDSLSSESRRATDALAGKSVSHVDRHRESEVLVEFTDGTRLFIDAPSAPLELSITGPDAERQHEPTIGQRVRLRDTGEVGVVVWVWKNSNADAEVYVAFFGKAFPNAVPESKPYVLRYFSTSLELAE